MSARMVRAARVVLLVVGAGWLLVLAGLYSPAQAHVAAILIVVALLAKGGGQ